MTTAKTIFLRDLSTNPIGFNSIAKIHHECQTMDNSDIYFDMSNVAWIEAHLTSALLCIIRILQKKNNNISFVNTKDRVRDILSRNGFFVSKNIKESGTVIPLKEFHISHGKEYAHYIRKNMDRMKLPAMTTTLRNKIYEGLDEIFINSTMHSNTVTNIFFSGQFFPKRDRIDFAISDAGIGMCGAYRKTYGLNLPSAEAINWAMTEGNTTRQGDIPGGLGLKILRKFIQLNAGRFIVVSRFGYWKEEKGVVEKIQMPFEFPGTIVTIEVNTADKNAYDLMHTPDPNNIW